MSERPDGYLIEVDGDPKPQPRPRAFARKFGPGNWQARVYTPGTAEAWKSAIAEAARPLIPAEPITGPIRLKITFRFARPKAHYRTGRHAGQLRPDAPAWHTGAPDRDNLEKAVMDALTVIGFWKDDGQVCTGTVAKVYAERPGASITVVPIEANVAGQPDPAGQPELALQETLQASARADDPDRPF